MYVRLINLIFLILKLRGGKSKNIPRYVSTCVMPILLFEKINIRKCVIFKNRKKTGVYIEINRRKEQKTSPFA